MIDSAESRIVDAASAQPQGEELCTLRELQVRYIARVLQAVGGNQRRAAETLGVTRWTLARLLRKHGLQVHRESPLRCGGSREVGLGTARATRYQPGASVAR